MRLFQNSGVYAAYFERLNGLAGAATSYLESRDAFLADRYGACHVLLPVLEKDPVAFFTNGDDPKLQRLWAAEQGMPAKASLTEILLAQVESHRAEVFYNLDPMRYGSDFIHRLPGSVKHSIAWRAAPSPNADFAAYSLVVCNFPGILASYEKRGWRNAYFAPAYDPEMGQFAESVDRPIDVVFVGGYTRHHRRRAELLERIAKARRRFSVVYHLDRSRFTRLAESPIGRLLPLSRHRRPADILNVSVAPVFGLELYTAFSRAKIVLNAAIDMAGNDRGNMRCFEALGCGALMVTDEGVYPSGLRDGETMLTYSSAEDAVRVIAAALERPAYLHQIAWQGLSMIRSKYSKEEQWRSFVQLVSQL